MDHYAITNQQTLERISRHCPESLSAYLQCINNADDKGLVYFTRDHVEVNMSENWCKFRNNIKKLAREDLLEWHPFNDGISVTMADLDE